MVDETKQLIAKKVEMEKEIEQILVFLATPEVRGFKIFDEQGFPNPDGAKIIAIRTQQHRLAELRTDHKQIMQEIEQSLYRVHAESRLKKSSEGGAAVAPSSSSTSQKQTEVKLAATSTAPSSFKLSIDEVAKGSPAEKAGLRVGDSVLRFGTVEVSSVQRQSCLAAIAGVVNDSKDRTVRVEVVHESGKSESVSLTPSKWSGRGLLGCHFVLV